MKIQIKGYLSFSRLDELPPCLELEEDSTLRDLLSRLPGDIRRLIETRGDADANRKDGAVAILINGRHYTHLPDRLEYTARGWDEVAVFPPVAGG